MFWFLIPALALAACSPTAKFDDETAAPCDGSPAIASGGIYIDDTVSKRTGSSLFFSFLSFSFLFSISLSHTLPPFFADVQFEH